MKIEKLNDNQIRCTLTRSDLSARELKLSELAYGTEKAKSLFQDMMQQASFEFGFDAEDIPLMIEAIPSSADSIILIITKVEEPEELDTRFSKFAPMPNMNPTKKQTKVSNKLVGSEELSALLEKITDSVAKITEATREVPKIQLFSFSSLNTVIQTAKLLHNLDFGLNTLYKDCNTGSFTLVLVNSTQTTTDFYKLCNMLSEYGLSESPNSVTIAHVEEHGKALLHADAMQTLAML
jgi:Negative regulator of genetic competence, sporulation and motility